MNSNNPSLILEEALRWLRRRKGETLVQRPLGRTIKVRITFEGDGMLKDLGEDDAPFYL